MLVHMFRTLLSNAVTAIGQSGQFSLQLHTNQDNSQVVLTFWSGNVFNNLLLAEIPNSLMIAKEIFQIVSSFLAAFPSVPPLYSLLSFDGRTTKTIITESVKCLRCAWCLPFTRRFRQVVSGTHCQDPGPLRLSQRTTVFANEVANRFWVSLVEGLS